MAALWSNFTSTGPSAISADEGGDPEDRDMVSAEIEKRGAQPKKIHGLNLSREPVPAKHQTKNTARAVS